MGSNQSVLKDKGYTLVSEQDNTILVKNTGGDMFVIKKLNAKQGDVSRFIQKLNHPHIAEHKEIIPDRRCLYLVTELCKGGDLPQIIKIKKEATEVLDWTVNLCMALKHLHDQQILHRHLQPKSIFFTACRTIRLGEFEVIREWSTDAQTVETEALSYVAPEILSGEPYDEKSEIWSLGCIIYEMCMLKCAFAGKNTVDIIPKILRSSYKALPETFSQDLRQLVRDTLQKDPANRPSVSEILMRPFIIKHLYEKSTQTIKELNVLKVLEELADGLERVHYNTTVSSLTGGVIGLAGGITSIVGFILTPFTLGASLIVTGVGIGVAVAGGVTAGASNITKMVNQNSNRQKIKMLITELQEKITSTSCCIQNIQIAVEMQQRYISKSNQSWSNAQSGADVWASAGARLGRGLGGISELVRLTEVASVGKVAAQAARTVRVAEAATGVLSTLFVAVDILFIALDSSEIHKLRRDYASIATQQESTNTESKSNQTPHSESEHNDTQNQPSPNNNEQELRSEIMKFVKKIRVTVEELNKHLNELKHELEENGNL
uniref:non-specific serine/threonine protein kinase n=1 Tax=Sinocyclocheilus grahami TaxID=75366 RepID=A0A672LW32_SINGR